LPPAFSQIQTAQVTGREIEGVVKHGVASFKGIPFAAPPIGGLRWKPPQPVVPWSGVLKADVNFARTGDPNGPGLPSWPAFDEKEMKAMVFDNAPSARPLPNLEKLKLFDGYSAWHGEQAKTRSNGER
jgi:para-nitrobenzyl esterase